MVTVDADLTVALLGTDDEPPFSVKITGQGRRVNVFISDPERLASVRRAQLHEVDALAKQLAAQGLTVRIDDPQVRSSRWATCGAACSHACSPGHRTCVSAR